MAFVLTRDVTPEECHWLSETVPAGTVVYACHKPTYGCISWTGAAVTFSESGDYPFFELPRDAIEEAE